MADQVQVYFRFDRSARWPPVPSEGLAAVPAGEGTYRLLEVPFFVRNVALDDVVAAEPDSSAVLWAAERVRWAGHQTLRVNPRPPTTTAAVLAEFGALGLSGEELEEYVLVALDVPPATPAGPVKDLLLAGRADGRWWYEEACIGPAWPVDPPDPAAPPD